MQNNKRLLSSCIHKKYMLELSHASTQCTHGAVVKLFCSYLNLGDLSQSSIKLKYSRPWNRRTPDEVHVILM
jgi:hypothetical protein